MEKLLSPGDIQQMLSIDRSTYYRLVKSGALPTLKIGGTFRHRPAQIEAYLRASEVRLPGRNIGHSSTATATTQLH